MFKIVARFSSAALLLLALVLLCSLPVYASGIAGFVAESENGDLYEYSYDDLIDSYALKLLGKSDGFYEDFAEKNTYAILLKSGKYIDYKDVLDRYAEALVNNKEFDLNKYTETDRAKFATMPSTIKAVKLNSGQIEFNTKRLSYISEIITIDPDFVLPRSKTPLAGPAEVTAGQGKKWAESHGAHQRFLEIASLYWEYGEITGIRPEVLYAQAAIETRFGKFNTQLNPDDYNWGGIRVADPDDSGYEYEAFAEPRDGVRAHFNHLAAYMGLNPVGEPHERYHVVKQQSWAGTIMYIDDLSGKWTTSDNYHAYILFAIDQMRKMEVEEVEEPDNSPKEEQEKKEKANDQTEQNRDDAQDSDENDRSDSDSDNVPNPDDPEPEIRPIIKYVAVDVNILHLREEPSTDDEILERLPLGTVLAVTGEQGAWLRVKIPGGEKGWVHGDYVISLEIGNPGDALKGKTIVVDPGHGGADPGAIGYSGLKEKVVNLITALELARLLDAAGAEVVLTRTGDQTVSNLRRVNLANDSGADLFISIHANSYAKNDSNGTEAFYYPNGNSSSDSRFLAGLVQKELVDVLGLRDRGVKTNSFYVIKNVDVPAALVELAFLSNPKEETLLKDEKVLHSCAEALYRGIEAYFVLNR